MSEQPRRWRLDLVGYGVGVACVAIVAFFLFASPTAHFSTGTGPSLAASCLSPVHSWQSSSQVAHNGYVSLPSLLTGTALTDAKIQCSNVDSEHILSAVALSFIGLIAAFLGLLVRPRRVRSA